MTRTRITIRYGAAIKDIRLAVEASRAARAHELGPMQRPGFTIEWLCAESAKQGERSRLEKRKERSTRPVDRTGPTECTNKVVR